MSSLHLLVIVEGGRERGVGTRGISRNERKKKTQCRVGGVSSFAGARVVPSAPRAARLSNLHQMTVRRLILVFRGLPLSRALLALDDSQGWRHRVRRRRGLWERHVMMRDES